MDIGYRYQSQVLRFAPVLERYNYLHHHSSLEGLMPALARMGEKRYEHSFRTLSNRYARRFLGRRVRVPESGLAFCPCLALSL
jgi:hypothetical protein